MQQMSGVRYYKRSLQNGATELHKNELVPDRRIPFSCCDKNQTADAHILGFVPVIPDIVVQVIGAQKMPTKGYTLVLQRKPDTAASSKS